MYCDDPASRSNLLRIRTMPDSFHHEPEKIAAAVAEVLPKIPQVLSEVEAHATEDRKRGTAKAINWGWIQTVCGVLTIAGMLLGMWNHSEVRAEVTSSEVRNMRAEVAEVKEAVKQLKRDEDARLDTFWQMLLGRKQQIMSVAPSESFIGPGRQ
jgi:ABC-type histidine transport system ATPase subunit